MGIGMGVGMGMGMGKRMGIGIEDMQQPAAVRTKQGS